MKRSDVVEIMIGLKRNIELNKESIVLQERRFGMGKGISEYLKGKNDAHQAMHDMLSKKC